MKRIGIPIKDLKVEGNKAVVKQKRYDVSTELKRRHSPPTKFRKPLPDTKESDRDNGQ